MNQNQIQLPERVVIHLAAVEVVVILQALSNHGPYKDVFPIVRSLEQQMIAQQLKPPAQPEPVDALE